MQKQTNPTMVAKRLLSKPNLSHIPAIKWGVDNEEIARQDYVSEMLSTHINFKCVNAGLVVNPTWVLVLMALLNVIAVQGKGY